MFSLRVGKQDNQMNKLLKSPGKPLDKLTKSVTKCIHIMKKHTGNQMPMSNDNASNLKDAKVEPGRPTRLMNALQRTLKKRSRQPANIRTGNESGSTLPPLDLPSRPPRLGLRLIFSRYNTSHPHPGIDVNPAAQQIYAIEATDRPNIMGEGVLGTTLDQTGSTIPYVDEFTSDPTLIDEYHDYRDRERLVMDDFIDTQPDEGHLPIADENEDRESRHSISNHSLIGYSLDDMSTSSLPSSSDEESDDAGTEMWTTQPSASPELPSTSVNSLYPMFPYGVRYPMPPATRLVDPSEPSQFGNYIEQPDTCYIERLPQELLDEIFVHSLPKRRPVSEWGLNPDWSHPRSSESPWVLRRVCRHWADSVLSLRLWGPIVCSVARQATDLNPNPTPDTEARTRWLKSRSRRRITDPVDFVSYNIGNKPLTRDSKEMMDILTEALFDCEVARIILPSYIVSDRFGSTPPLYPRRKMTRLRALSWMSPVSLSTELPSALRLPWLSLKVGTTLNSSIPWHQLNALFLKCPMSVDDCLDVLRGCPDLKTIELSDLYIPNTIVGSVVTPGLNHELSSLAVRSEFEPNGLFDNVNFSNLKHLYLDMVGIPGRLRNTNVPWNSLESLVLNGALGLADAHGVFKHCHSVTKLHWNWPNDIETTTNIIRITDIIGIEYTPLSLPRISDLVITPTLPDELLRLFLELMVEPISFARSIALPLHSSIVSRGTTFSNAIQSIKLTGPISISECLTILHRFQFLEKLDVLVRSDVKQAVNLPSMITQVTLRSLKVHTPLTNLQGLLDRLTLPFLSEVALKCEPHKSRRLLTARDPQVGEKDACFGPYQRGFYSLLDRSGVIGEKLECLGLKNFDVEEAELKNVEEAIQSLNIRVEIDTIVTNPSTGRSRLFRLSNTP